MDQDRPAPPTTTEDQDGPTEGDVAATYCATLVDEWVRCGLTDAVVSPGSRSTPMALALADHAEVALHVHHDERSASFMALGLGIATGRPAALLCTSGTAATQFHAAVVEAHQAFVPVLVLTADRPSELQNVGAPQTIDQRDLYGTAVRWYCEPGAPAVGGAPWWRDLARDAWTRTLGEHPGPVHLNLAFREPLVGTAGELPPADDPPSAGGALHCGPVGAQWGMPDEQIGGLAEAMSGRRGVVLAGVRAASSAEDVAAVHQLATRLGWPVIADAPSGCRVPVPGCITTADALLRHPTFADSHRPEVVLRLGGLLTSRALYAWLATTGALQVGVDRFGATPDPDGVLGLKVPGDVGLVCDQLRAAAGDPAPTEWRTSWIDADGTARDTIERVLGARTEATEPGVVIDVSTLLSDDGLLVVSSSMPVRDLEWFAPARTGVRVLCNRGANGIDGVTSTAVGAALTGAPTALLIGDVAFLHDTNALLGLARRALNLVIVVIDNDGGGIFSFLPQREAVPVERFEQLFGTPHGVDLVGLAAAHGIPAERVSSRAGLQAAVAGALTRGGARVVVVGTDRDANVALHASLNSSIAGSWEEPGARG